MFIEKKFWGRVKKQRNGCWLWCGPVRPDGYGFTNRDGKNQSVHRISYELHFGVIPTGLLVCHHCDVPRCVNPNHLFLGTNRDNMQDASKKGRMSSGERHHTHLYPERLIRGESHFSHTHPELVARGEKCPSAKLTAFKVKRIRSLRRKGMKLKDIANLFKVSIPCVYQVVIFKTWRHVR